MFKSYFKIALRNLRKQKVYSLINVLGFAAGMACFIIISLYVLHEYSFDKFHEKSDRIYRIVAEHKWYDQFNRIAITSGPLAPALVRDAWRDRGQCYGASVEEFCQAGAAGESHCRTGCLVCHEQMAREFRLPHRNIVVGVCPGWRAGTFHCAVDREHAGGAGGAGESGGEFAV